ncbi:hypothetical protein BGZ63DRAFT_119752 [Mariannaea sp. PMI_226]|nr:hypothetical protein BGZ63DRAFT_119752 [Mariannaea sp. PMI_226]
MDLVTETRGLQLFSGAFDFSEPCCKTTPPAQSHSSHHLSSSGRLAASRADRLPSIVEVPGIDPANHGHLRDAVIHPPSTTPHLFPLCLSSAPILLHSMTSGLSHTTLHITSAKKSLKMAYFVVYLHDWLLVFHEYFVFLGGFAMPGLPQWLPKKKSKTCYAVSCFLAPVLLTCCPFLSRL